MCERTNLPIAPVCRVGHLLAGEKYRDPAGETYLVLDVATNLLPLSPTTVVVNIRTGKVIEARSDIHLGRDRKGRLYAARQLNRAPKPVDTVPIAEVLILPPDGICLGDEPQAPNTQTGGGAV